MSAHEHLRHAVLCADDFGGSPLADEAILQLAQRGSISAVSAFADGRSTDGAVAALRCLPPAVSVGLHLNLTEPLDEAPVRPLASWVARSVVPGAIDRDLLCAEIERQCMRFESRYRRAPDFIDGHEHVHQFAVVRGCLLSVVQRRYATRVAVRTTAPRAWRGPKAALIAALGGRALARELQWRAMAANCDFGGVYGFGTRTPYAERMAGWLATLADHGLLMCHPQLADPDFPSPAREAEFAFLASPEWDSLRREQRVALVPFGSPFPP